MSFAALAQKFEHNVRRKGQVIVKESTPIVQVKKELAAGARTPRTTNRIPCTSVLECSHTTTTTTTTTTTITTTTSTPTTPSTTSGTSTICLPAKLSLSTSTATISKCMQCGSREVRYSSINYMAH